MSKLDIYLEEVKDKEKCSKGYRWCPIKKKCVPEDEVKGMGRRMGRGQGEGPIGRPFITKEQIHQVMEMILDEYDADGEPNELKSVPSQDPSTQLDRLEDDLGGASGEEAPEGEAVESDEEDDEFPKGRMGDGDSDLDDYYADDEEVAIANEMVEELLMREDNTYQLFFRDMMKKHGLDSIKRLPPEKKRAFFNDVKKSWRSKKVKEQVFGFDIDDKILFEEYKKYFKYIMEKCGISDLREISEEDAAELFALTNEGFLLVHGIE